MSFANGLKTIVVATDLDGQAEGALEYARKLAENYGARIVLAHGLDPMDYAAVDTVPGQVLDGLTEKARKVLDAMVHELVREGIHSHSEVRQGAVTTMLLDVARQYDAGLILIGTKGMEGAGPVVVGTIAEELVRHAPCPVMAVAADWNAGPNRPTPGGPVLLTMEQNEATDAAIVTACSLAEKFHRLLLVLHVRSEDEVAAGANPCARMEDYGFHLHAKAPVICVTKDGDPADAVAEAIEEHHPCILVAGVKRTSGTPGPHGTSFRLLARSKVPVLCVPPANPGSRIAPDKAQPVAFA